MKRNVLLLILLVSVIFGMNACKKSNTDIVYNHKYVDQIKAARKEMQFYMIQNFVPGANIAVSIDGEVVYSEGIGLASKDLEVPAKRNTKFRIGEASTLFTNAIYLKMVEEGKLHPDSSVQYYFPEFPVKKEGKITLHLLANEISGIRPSQNNEEFTLTNGSIEQGINLFKDDPLDMPSGMFQTTSCFNSNLLGVVMEKATGEKYQTLLKDYVTDTLHMDNTLVDNPYAIIKGRSDFFESNLIAQVVNLPSYDLRAIAPSKGLLSNAEDLVKLGNAYLSSGFFSEETRKNLFVLLPLPNENISRMVNEWLVFQDKQGRTVYGLEGGVKGGSASVIIYPEEKMVIGYACNLSSSVNDTPVFRVANAFLDTPEEKK